MANHTSADTPELVDPAELRRTAVIAAACIAAVRGQADPELAADVAEATLSWAAEHVLAVLPGRRQPMSGSVERPAFDPHAAPNAARWLRHRGAVALGAVDALTTIGVDAGWLASARAWLDSQLLAVAGRLPALASTDSETRSAGTEADHAADQVLVRCWAGPANLRALAGAACPADQHWLNDRLAADRGGNYARALALMRAIDGDRCRSEATWWAALSSELAMPLSFAETFLDLLTRAGWVRPDSQGGQS